MDFYKFYRLEFSLRNLGISLVALASLLPLTGIPNVFEASLALVQLLLIQMNSFSMNHYFDYKAWGEDNYMKQLLDSGWSQTKIVLFTLLPLVALALTLPFSNIYFLILPIYTILFYLYQGTPFRLKENYTWSIILNSICLGLILYIYPYLFIAETMTITFLVFSITFFCYMAFHEVIHQIAHQDKDRTYSLPEAKGIKRAVLVAKIFLYIPMASALIALITSPVRYLFFTGIILFSALRLHKLSQVGQTKEEFQKLRNRWDKLYSFQEAIYSIVLLMILYFPWESL